MFVANDTLAIGVLKALNERQIRVPEQIALISINDIPAAQFTIPSLSTVKIPSEVMGVQAVRELKDRIENNRTHILKIVVPYTIFFRGTTLQKDAENMESATQKHTHTV